MKNLIFIPALLVAILMSSCNSVEVATDYDRQADFDTYKTYAFYKPGVDKAEISDLDKRRILRAIDASLNQMGFEKTKENPDLLVSFFTKTEKNVNIYQNSYGAGYGWGYGYGPYWGAGFRNNYPSVSTSTDGTLFIDLVDKNSMNLVWQGMGKGILSLEMDKKIERIQEMVQKIMEQYPPGKQMKK
jgi:hypothetical protein